MSKEQMQGSKLDRIKERERGSGSAPGCEMQQEVWRWTVVDSCVVTMCLGRGRAVDGHSVAWGIKTVQA